ncbi:MAG: bifunctional UDP-N-acetylglucosamine diphosphorylase/glucosamine-1-phosphate N-acetyltransferase GlmU [Candidatus Bipolaricaulota bacterium]|nr:bifunctional UDP-N-acetylglucosamine diphosphorylase/glucosamine-1-phosphate N-acetyltransferase GlmU [Candidatus Bipolaricaulota bacterium]MCX7844434.1 bifunctional UDP-N-acetylglucosamine diphosphorylase/glucosamine-1-phosphate N-acetyltransferase GlmU [Candidatus Bipolaricaulota bacterium]MDW8151600.1 bifunctional UDP-N-acetylglucosamine diphosphorylase/glucosamine-1-phosphate N-acetyltransferase GlmU [Candidatus Bipolaricaulota bacterium]
MVLAAGRGTRMRSARPKVLHPLCGLPLLAYPLRAARALAPRQILVVVAHGKDEVQAAFSAWPVRFVDQGEPLGTGHAVRQVQAYLAAPRFLVLPGDAPLVPPEALQALVEHHCRAGALASFLTFAPADPGPYGRVVRDESGRPKRIVEAREASPAELALREVNGGVWCLENVPALWEALARITPDNAQGEYYLTDLVALLYPRVAALLWPHPEDLLGVNDRRDLARLEGVLRARILEAWMREGVSVPDPSAVYPGPDARVAPDALLLPGTFLYGETEVGPNCVIGPQAYLVDAKVAEGARIWYSVVEGAWVGAGAQIGPFAHLRAGARIGARARIGNFVEVKASQIGEGTKALHLAYIGDAEVGPGANIGAGAITCNFQPGKPEKFRTEIGAGAFIGSNACLIAPLRIGEGAVVGAGSVITEDVPPYALALARSPQVVKPDWARRLEER